MTRAIPRIPHMSETFPLAVKAPQGATIKRLTLPAKYGASFTVEALVFGQMAVYRSIGPLKNGWTLAHRRTGQAALVHVAFLTAVKYARILDEHIDWSSITLNRTTKELKGWGGALKKQVAVLIAPVWPEVMRDISP